MNTDPRLAEITARAHASDIPWLAAELIEALGKLGIAERQNGEQADEVIALREQLARVAAFTAERAEYVSNLRSFVEGGEHDYYRWTGHAEARRQLSNLLGLPVGWPAEDKAAVS